MFDFCVFLIKVNIKCVTTLMLVDWSFWKKYLWKDSGTLSRAMTASQRQPVCCKTTTIIDIMRSLSLFP